MMGRAAEPTNRAPINGEVFLSALAEHGVDFFFCNPGTDFPPIVEAFARARQTNRKTPRPIVVPHENLAVAMAHGAWLMTGRPQAVMVHVNVGTANTVNMLANLARDNIPLLLAAGRTPITEQGAFGTRSRQIHWAQEMFDQAGMVRELVKWDYEFRLPGRIDDVVVRALEVACTSPQGPVYLSLPREPLAAPAPEGIGFSRRAVPTRPAPDPAAIRTLAQWIAEARRPLLITGACGRDRASFEALSAFAERWAVPVVPFNPRYVALPSSHPMHFGFDPAPHLPAADLVIVLESDAPWFPSRQSPPAGCRIAHIGEDPAYQRYPMRSFQCDLAVTAEAAAALGALDAALSDGGGSSSAIEARRAAFRDGVRPPAQPNPSDRNVSSRGSDLGSAHFSRCVGDLLGPDDIVFNEYPLVLDHVPRERPGTYFGISPAGGLGWGLGAALGAKLAAPDRFVVAAVGDGAYLFNNPAACHLVAEANALPVLTVVYNNGLYGAVRRATLAMFADGAAGADDGRLLAEIGPSPRYEDYVRAHGGHGERVERPEELAPALARARAAVVAHKRQALINVVCPI